MLARMARPIAKLACDEAVLRIGTSGAQNGLPRFTARRCSSFWKPTAAPAASPRPRWACWDGSKRNPRCADAQENHHDRAIQKIERLVIAWTFSDAWHSGAIALTGAGPRANRQTSSSANQQPQRCRHGRRGRRNCPAHPASWPPGAAQLSGSMPGMGGARSPVNAQIDPAWR